MEVKVRNLIKEAMKNKNETAKLVYKSVLDGALKLAKLDGNRAVKDDDFVKAAKNEIKALKDLEDILVKSGKIDRIAEVKEKIALFEVLVPQMATDEQVKEFLVANNIEKNMGACMKALKAQFGSTLDGKAAQAVVKEYLS